MTDGVPHEYKESIGTCAACGNSPINHFETYVIQSLSVWVSEEGTIRSLLRRLSVRTARISERLEEWLCAFLSLLPITRFNREPHKARTYRSQVIWEEAQRRGIEMEQFVIFGSYTELYRARLGSQWNYFLSLPVPNELRRDMSDHIDDKFKLKKILKARGVAVPHVYSVAKAEDALRALESIGKSVAIKPRLGTRGRHTTVRVNTASDCTAAFASAQQLCRHVVIEEYLEGPVCRGTVVAGRLVGFFEAQPPKITGDGRSTVRELIAAFNLAKPERVQDIQLTKEHEDFLQRSGFTQESVLKSGEEITLTHRTGRLFGGRTRELLGQEHPKLRTYLEKAAQVLKTPVVGFDLIIPDPRRDPDSQQWGIIEANTLPFIDLHYLPLEGTPSNVAAAVWDLWKDREAPEPISIHSVASAAQKGTV